MGDFSILGKRIKELRTSLKKTQREFASLVGCTAATLSAYENGSKSPSLEIVKSIAEKCDVSIDWLCGLSSKPNNDDIPKTYSEVIEIFINLEKAHICCIKPEGIYKWSKPHEKGELLQAYGHLTFYDMTLAKFLKDWSGTKELHDKKTIDDNLYKLWIKQQLETYLRPFSSEDEEFFIRQILEQEHNAPY